MNKLRGLAILTVALLPLAVTPASAQGTPFASFQGGLFQFTNLDANGNAGTSSDGSGSTFTSVGPTGTTGGPEVQFVDEQHPNVAPYTNFTINLTSTVTNGGAAVAYGNVYTQTLGAVTFKFIGPNGLDLLTATGNAVLSVDFDSKTGTFSGDNSRLSVQDVQYTSSILKVDNKTPNNTYASDLDLSINGPLTLNANGYFDNFTANAQGIFTTAVPEASTLVGFGMLMGGGLLGMRRLRRVKVA